MSCHSFFLASSLLTEPIVKGEQVIIHDSITLLYPPMHILYRRDFSQMSNPIPEDNLTYLLQEKERLDGQYNRQTSRWPSEGSDSSSCVDTSSLGIDIRGVRTGVPYAEVSGFWFIRYRCQSDSRPPRSQIMGARPLKRSAIHSYDYLFLSNFPT